MPNAAGYITNKDIAKMRDLALAGWSRTNIAREIGCAESRVTDYSGGLVRKIARAKQYNTIVMRASAFVPTFGGGR